MTIKSYLSKTHRPSTVKNYLFEINHFVNYFGEEKSRVASYKDVMNYVVILRDQYDNNGTLRRVVNSIKHYFFYLIEIGEREDHPCRYLSIAKRRKNEIQLQDLLKEEVLELLLEREERYELLRVRNRVIMSLLIYQGLRVKEICNLKPEDVDLDKGEIRIKAMSKTNGRTLSLKPRQIMLFYKYMEEVRNQLLKTKTDSLILTKVGSAEQGEGIHYLVSTYKKQYKNKRLTPTVIRQSVLANLLSKGIDLRIVQVFAGHQTPSATERYRQTNIEQLKTAVNKYHPLG